MLLNISVHIYMSNKSCEFNFIISDLIKDFENNLFEGVRQVQFFFFFHNTYLFNNIYYLIKTISHISESIINWRDINFCFFKHFLWQDEQYLTLPNVKKHFRA